MSRKHEGIEQRGPDTWRVTVAAGRDPETDRYLRVRETVKGTISGAPKRRDELRVEIAHGTHVRADDPVAVYVPGWIAKSERLGNIRPKVAYTYAGYVRREVVPRIGRLRLDAVRPPHVQRIVDELLEAGRAPRTVVQVHRILHAALRDAVRLGVLRANPCDGVKLPKLPRKALRIPKAADVERLLEALRTITGRRSR